MDEIIGAKNTEPLVTTEAVETVFAVDRDVYEMAQRYNLQRLEEHCRKRMESSIKELDPSAVEKLVKEVYYQNPSSGIGALLLTHLLSSQTFRRRLYNGCPKTVRLNRSNNPSDIKDTSGDMAFYHDFKKLLGAHPAMLLRYFEYSLHSEGPDRNARI